MFLSHLSFGLQFDFEAHLGIGLLLGLSVRSFSHGLVLVIGDFSYGLLFVFGRGFGFGLLFVFVRDFGFGLPFVFGVYFGLDQLLSVGYLAVGVQYGFGLLLVGGRLILDGRLLVISGLLIGGRLLLIDA